MFKAWGRTACLAGIPVVAALTLGGEPARANLDTPVAFSLPAGDLASTLVAISRLGNIMISFSPGIVAGRNAAPVQGTLTVYDALLRVLAGTGLRLQPGPNGVTVVGDSSASAGAVPAGDIAAIDVTDESGMSRFGDVGFQGGNAGDTVRIAGAPAKEIALTVNTVTSNVIRSQGIVTPTDAVQNVSGVSVGGTLGGADSFVVRGFETSDVFVNGQGLSRSGFQATGFGQIPIDDVERVEVLKGPTSILSGASTNGGAINLSTKQPTSREIRDLTVRYGSFNYKTIALDLGGPVADAEGLTYRLNLSGNHADRNYAGYRVADQFLISPAVRWENGDTSILAGLRYSEQARPLSQYTFVPVPGSEGASRLLHIPRGIPYVNPNLRFQDRTLTLYSDQSHHFGDLFGFDVTFNNRFQFQKSSNDFNLFAWSGQRFPTAPAGTYNASQSYIEYNFSRILNQSDVTLTYDAGFARQTSKFGVDVSDSLSRLFTNRSNTFSVNLLTGLPRQDILSTAPTSPSRYSTYGGQGLGYYYLEKFDTLDDRLHILGQVRYDQNRFFTGSGFPGQETFREPTHPEGMSWFAGAVFDVTPYFSIYGNRSTGFVPVLGTLGDTGNLPPPETRDQHEIGGRFFLFDKKLSLTAAYFDLSATNVSICDPQLPTCSEVFIVPGRTSKGFEFDMQGELFPGMNVIGSFASTVVKYTSTDYSPPTAGIPQYTASLWGAYTFQGGTFQGLTLGLGARGNSNSTTFLTRGVGNLLYNVPGYVTADALIGYDFDRWSIQFKVNNIFDKYYYRPSFSGTYVGIGEGRTFLLTARYSFE